MTNSAHDRIRDAERLDDAVDLYRDLSGALRQRITLLKTHIGEDPDCGESVKALQNHHKALQTVLDIEERLGKRTNAGGAGGSVELDLDAARQEILARLARWAAGQ